MNFSTHWFPENLLLAAWLPLLLILAATWRPAWQRLRQSPQAVAAVCLIFALLWSLRVQLAEGDLAGMNYHLLGINLAVLMLGAPAALWLGSLMLPAYLLLSYGGEALNAAAFNVCAVFLPAVGINLLLRRLAEKLPDNLFIYIFVNGFLSAALGMMLTGALICALLTAAGIFDTATLWGKAFLVFFLISWGEAFLSGLFCAIFVALAPQLLATFNERRYLKPQNRIWPPAE